jgi:hypothetical protein
VATSNSTLPPLLNGIEPMGVPTYIADVSAITSIKEVYQIKKECSYDPCVPKEFIWNGVSCTCTYNFNIPRITAMSVHFSFSDFIIQDLSVNYIFPYFVLEL